MNFESMTYEQIIEKTTELNKMRRFYLVTQKPEMVKQIDSLLDACYGILDERREVTYFEDFVGKNTGVVLDNLKSSKEDNAAKAAARPKRQIRDGSPLQRNPGRKSAFDRGPTE